MVVLFHSIHAHGFFVSFFFRDVVNRYQTTNIHFFLSWNNQDHKIKQHHPELHLDCKSVCALRCYYVAKIGPRKMKTKSVYLWEWRSTMVDKIVAFVIFIFYFEPAQIEIAHFFSSNTRLTQPNFFLYAQCRGTLKTWIDICICCYIVCCFFLFKQKSANCRIHCLCEASRYNWLTVAR